jgi:hypothetical protein
VTIQTLGFEREERSGDIYFCEPTPGLGVAVWWHADCATYTVRPFDNWTPSHSLHHAWLRTPVGRNPPGMAPVHVGDSPLAALATIEHFVDIYLKEQENERRILAAARADDERTAAKRDAFNARVARQRARLEHTRGAVRPAA